MIIILYKQYTHIVEPTDENIPEVGLEIVLKSAEISDIVTKLGASPEMREPLLFQC